jgi:hypothetical protein
VQQTWKLALQSSCVVKKNMDKTAENELKFGEDAQHLKYFSYELI